MAASRCGAQGRAGTLEHSTLLTQLRGIGFLRISLRIPCISRGGTSSRLLGVDGCPKLSDERASTMLEDRQVGQEYKQLWRLRSG
jgi:hypothetical protein